MERYIYRRGRIGGKQVDKENRVSITVIEDYLNTIDIWESYLRRV